MKNKKQREIKFRAWDKKDKKMYQVTGIEWNGWGKLQRIQIMLIENGDIRYSWKNFYDDSGNHFILMLYIGLKDKNGREIYEGDILRSNYNYHGKPDKTILGVVDYDDYDTRFEVLLPARDGKLDVYPTCISSFLEWGKAEVIGNIYKNPELLKQI